MDKELSEMTLEELWELFPIFLVEPNAKWQKQYQDAEASICGILKKCCSDFRISHIGSTSINGIWAKDIVDILIEFPSSVDLDSVSRLLEQNGYVLMCRSEGRVSLNCGYTKEGFAEKVFHVHLRHFGDNDELYFRDYLNEHADVAKEYEALKLGLWKRFEHNRDGYTEAKTDFIRKWTQEAIRVYSGRY